MVQPNRDRKGALPRNLSARFLAVAVRSETQAYTQLRGEWNSYRRSGPEEIAERAGWNQQLFEAGDGLGLGARSVEAKCGGIGQIVDRDRQGGNIRHVICAGIIAVEQIEEFGKRGDFRTLSDLKGRLTRRSVCK